MKLILSESQIIKLITPLIETSGELDKHYVKTGIFDDNDRRIILSITGGDNYTKLIADMYKYFTNKYNPEMVEPKPITDSEIKWLKKAHHNLKTYNKNVFPLKDLYHKDYYTHPLGNMHDMETRVRLIEKIKNFPSLWLRNLKDDIRKPRNDMEFKMLNETINKIESSLKLIYKIKPEQQEKIIKKVFSSKFTTFEEIQKRLDDTTIPYLSEDSTVDELIEKIEDMGGEAEIVYNENNILVVIIKSSNAMQYIGCSSQWCFANGSGHWEDYTNHGYATIVFNFNEDPYEANRMVVVLDTGEVYNMYNDYMEEGDSYLEYIGVSDVVPYGNLEDRYVSEGINREKS